MRSIGKSQWYCVIKLSVEGADVSSNLDIGTTAVKAVVVNEDGEPIFTGSSVIHTIETGNFKEQDPDEWYGSFCKLSKEMFEIIPPKEIGAIIFPGRCRT